MQSWQDFFQSLEILGNTPQRTLVKKKLLSLNLQGIKLKITNDALEYIVKKALELKVGARGLRSICETIMQDAMFELPSQKSIKTYTVNADYAMRKFEQKEIASLKVAW